MTFSNQRLKEAAKKLATAQANKFGAKATAVNAGAVGSAFVSIDGGLAPASLPDGTTGEIAVVNSGRLANAKYSTQAGGTTIVTTRSTSGSTGTGTGVTDHGALTGLGDDDHTQYLLANGARTLTGTLSVTGNISVTGNVDGVDISAHATNANAHHNQSHVLATTSALGSDHTVSGLTSGYVLKATGATTAAFGQLLHSQLGSIGANDHHNQQHSITGSDHTVTGSTLDVVGLTGTNTLGVLTPSNNPGAAAKILASDSGGGLTLQSLTVASDTDATTILGRAKLFSVATDSMMLAHFDHATATNYAFRQTSNGLTLINAPSGQTIYHRINNADIMTMTAGGLTISGGNLSITGAGDLTVGSNIFFVDNSGSNVGINCAPDAQFDLDVLGNFRAQGFIVGKHAIQISDAVAIYHWDGVSTNTTGETRSHLGQVPTNILNTPEFLPGKFGKALSVGSAATALITNNSFETDTSGWSTSSATIARTNIFQAHGGYSALFTPTAAGGFIWTTANANTVNGTVYTGVVWLRCNTGTITIRLGLQNNGGTTTYGASTVTVTTTWQMFSVTATATAADQARFFIQNQNNTTPVYVDAVQLFASSTPLPFISATRSGEAHAIYNSQNVNPNQGTLMCWVKPYTPTTQGYVFNCLGGTNSDRIQLLINSAGKWRFIVGVNGDVVGTTVSSAGNWYHVAVTWNNGTANLFVNGALEATGAYTAFTTIPATYRWGNNVTAINAEMDDCVIRSIESSAAEIRAIYESNAPVFAETSTFNFRAGSGLVWADAEGLWMYDSSGTAIMGVSAVNSKSWGGRTINTGDFSLGQYGASNGGWFLFDQIDTSSKPSLTMGYGTTEALRFDSSGNKITGALTVTGSLSAGGATIDANGVGIGVDNSFFWSTAVGFQNVSVTTGKSYRFTGATGNNFLGITGDYSSNTSTLAMVNENEAASGASKSSRIILDARAITDGVSGSIGTSTIDLAASQWAPNQGGIVNVAKISMSVSDASNISITLDSKSATIKGGLPYAVLAKQSSTPTVYGYDNDQALMYFKGTKLIVTYNDGTVRYKYLDLAGTGTTWTHTTTAP